MKRTTANVFCCGAVLLTLFGGYARAQTAPPAAPVPAAATPDPSYRIAPDDTLTVTVVNFPKDFPTQQVLVTPDGLISVPFLGAVPVAGKTTDQVAQTLTRGWKKYVVDPSVSVSLMTRHAEQVVVGGFVAHPGVAPYRPSLRVLDAIAQSGDVLPNGDMSKVVVTHGDHTQQTLDLSHPERKGDSADNLTLMDKDAVYVPELRDEFSVVGEVTKPGSYPYKSDMTVMDAITEVGPVLQTADLHAATVTHNGHSQPIDLEAMLHRGDMSGNFKLAAGDQIVVPQGGRTYVYGAVAKPGFYQFQSNDRLLDALNAAGGPISGPDYGADLKKVNIVRPSPDKREATVIHVNAEDFLKNADMKGNPALRPGDAVFVSDRKSKPSWISALGPLGILFEGAKVLGL